MAEFTVEHIAGTIERCRAHVEQLAESFRTSLGCEVRLVAGEPTGLEAEGDLGDFQVPGLAVSATVGEQGLLVLIPQTLPLPAWFRQPDVTQSNQLQTLAQELAAHLLPDDLPADSFAAVATENLIEAAQNAQVAATGKMIELSAFSPDGTDESAFAKILVIVPVTAPPVHRGADFNASGELHHDAIEETFAEDSGEFDPVGQTAESQSHATAASADAALRALRIMRVPVTVSVRLAERKMPLGSVVALVPGSLVTFNKSCEDLLDLYVNNHRYCQGEAIKIGESFGLKVTKVGVLEERRERII